MATEQVKARNLKNIFSPLITNLLSSKSLMLKRKSAQADSTSAKNLPARKQRAMPEYEKRHPNSLDL